MKDLKIVHLAIIEVAKEALISPPWGLDSPDPPKKRPWIKPRELASTAYIMGLLKAATMISEFEENSHEATNPTDVA